MQFISWPHFLPSVREKSAWERGYTVQLASCAAMRCCITVMDMAIDIVVRGLHVFRTPVPGEQLACSVDRCAVKQEPTPGTLRKTLRVYNRKGLTFLS